MEFSWRKNLFSDIKIKFNNQNQVFSVHKFILAKHSPMLRSQLENLDAFIEGKKDLIELDMGKQNKEFSLIFPKALDLMYEEPISDLSIKEFVTLYSVLDFLLCEKLAKNLFSKNFDKLSQNPFKVLKESYIFEQGWLIKWCYKYLNTHFDSFDKEEYFQLDHDVLAEILSNQGEGNEDLIFEIVFSYIKNKKYEANSIESKLLLKQCNVRNLNIHNLWKLLDQKIIDELQFLRIVVAKDLDVGQVPYDCEERKDVKYKPKKTKKEKQYFSEDEDIKYSQNVSFYQKISHILKYVIYGYLFRLYMKLTRK